METRTSDLDAARRALAEADAGGQAIRATRPAPWFVPAAAGLVAAIALGQLLPWGGALAVAIVVLFGAAALVDEPVGWVLCAVLAALGVLVGGRIAARRT